MRWDETFAVADADMMKALGRSFAGRLVRGDVVLLHGDLGAGKTTFAQGVAAGLNVRDPALSPTFSIVAEHTGTDVEGRPIRLYHLDLYRLVDTGDLETLGYGQYIDPPDGISIIEWPERARHWLPESFWLLRITHLANGGRQVDRSWHAPDAD